MENTEEHAFNEIQSCVTENLKKQWALQAASSRYKLEIQKLDEEMNRTKCEIKKFEENAEQLLFQKETMKKIYEDQMKYLPINTKSLSIHHTYKTSLKETLKKQKEEDDKILNKYLIQYEYLKTKLALTNPSYKELMENKIELKRCQFDIKCTENLIKIKEKKIRDKREIGLKLFYSNCVSLAKSWLDKQKYEQAVQKLPEAKKDEQRLLNRYIDIKQETKEKQKIIIFKDPPQYKKSNHPLQNLKFAVPAPPKYDPQPTIYPKINILEKLNHLNKDENLNLRGPFTNNIGSNIPVTKHLFSKDCSKNNSVNDCSNPNSFRDTVPISKAKILETRYIQLPTINKSISNKGNTKKSMEKSRSLRAKLEQNVAAVYESISQKLTKTKSSQKNEKEQIDNKNNQESFATENNSPKVVHDVAFTEFQQQTPAEQSTNLNIGYNRTEKSGHFEIRGAVTASQSDTNQTSSQKYPDNNKHDKPAKEIQQKSANVFQNEEVGVNNPFNMSSGLQFPKPLNVEMNLKKRRGFFNEGYSGNKKSSQEFLQKDNKISHNGKFVENTSVTKGSESQCFKTLNIEKSLTKQQNIPVHEFSSLRKSSQEFTRTENQVRDDGKNKINTSSVPETNPFSSLQGKHFFKTKKHVNKNDNVNQAFINSGVNPNLNFNPFPIGSDVLQPEQTPNNQSNLLRPNTTGDVQSSNEPGNKQSQSNPAHFEDQSESSPVMQNLSFDRPNTTENANTAGMDGIQYNFGHFKDFMDPSYGSNEFDQFVMSPVCESINTQGQNAENNNQFMPSGFTFGTATDTMFNFM